MVIEINVAENDFPTRSLHRFSLDRVIFEYASSIYRQNSSEFTLCKFFNLICKVLAKHDEKCYLQSILTCWELNRCILTQLSNLRNSHFCARHLMKCCCMNMSYFTHTHTYETFEDEELSLANKCTYMGRRMTSQKISSRMCDDDETPKLTHISFLMNFLSGKNAD